MSPWHHSALDVCTEMTTYTVATVRQQTVMEALRAETARWVRHQPGFLTANCYPSADGTRVVHHVAWRTQSAWRAAQHSLELPIFEARLRAIPSIGVVDIHRYAAPETVTGPLEAVFTRPWTEDAVVSPHATIPGERQVVILQGKLTNNTMSVVGVIDLPQCGAPLHVHALEDETFHVLDGEYEIQVDEQVVHAGPGVTVFGPRGHPHTYRYLGESGVGHMVAIFTPAGVEGLFLAFDAWAASGKQPTREEFLDLVARFRVNTLKVPVG